ncbi:MAG: MFS transporter [Clostridiales bacterium]|nr:MFS transporter [Clostridiales bacterium]
MKLRIIFSYLYSIKISQSERTIVLQKERRFLLVLAIIIITFNLRAPIFSVGSVISMIQKDYPLSSALCGFLTTLPLIAFAASSPFVAIVSNRIGMQRTMFLGLLLSLFGILARSYFGIFGLFFGTALMGIGISCANVLIPCVIKSHFPEHVGLLTSIYCTAMSIFAGLGAGISVPLAEKFGFGWKGSLATWSLLCILAMIFWVPQLKQSPIPVSVSIENVPENQIKNTSLFRSRLAWAVTVYMGLQAIICYSATTWLPTILVSRGISAEAAGYMALYLQWISIIGAFIVPILADRISGNQKNINTIFCLSYFIGAVGLIFCRQSQVMIYLSLTFFGIGMGASFSLYLIFLSMRTRKALDTANLSGMSQSLGYLLAAVGPPAVGATFDVTKSWTPSLLFYVFCTIMLIVLGFYLGRDIYLFEEEQNKPMVMK